MRTCKACGEKRRTLARAIVVGNFGTPQPGLVCAACQARGVFVVPCLVAPVVASAERKEAGEVLAPFIRTLEGQLRGLAAGVGVGQVYGDDVAERGFVDGRIEALEGVIAMLKARRA